MGACWNNAFNGLLMWCVNLILILQLSLFSPLFILCVPTRPRALWVSCPNVWPYLYLYPVDRQLNEAMFTFPKTTFALLTASFLKCIHNLKGFFKYLECARCRKAEDLFWRGILWRSEASQWSPPLAVWESFDLPSFLCQTGSVPCWWWWDIQIQ